MKVGHKYTFASKKFAKIIDQRAVPYQLHSIILSYLANINHFCWISMSKIPNPVGGVVILPLASNIFMFSGHLTLTCMLTNFFFSLSLSLFNLSQNPTNSHHQSYTVVTHLQQRYTQKKNECSDNFFISLAIFRSGTRSS